MQLARHFWIAAVCTFAVLFGTTAVQAQPTKLLPNDTELVFSVNLQQILKSEVLKDKKELVDLVKAQISAGLEDKGVDKYLKAAGFDLFTDLNSVTVGVPAGRGAEESFVVIEGNFDAAKIKKAVTEAAKDGGAGAKLMKVADLDTFEISKDNKKIYIAVLNAKTIIACTSKTEFEGAVARSNGTKESKLKAEVKTLLETVNSKQSISLVATSAVLAKMADNAPEAAAEKAKAAALALQQVEGLSMAITIQKDIDFLIGINAKDAKTAADIAAKGNLGLGFFRASIAEKAKDDKNFVPAAEVLNTVRVTTQGSNLLVRGQISYENLGKIIANLPNLKQ